MVNACVERVCGFAHQKVLRFVFILADRVDGRRILVLSKTKPHASFLLDVVFFTDHVPAQHDLFRYWKETKACKTDVYLLPKHLDRSCLVVEGKVARLHLRALYGAHCPYSGGQKREGLRTGPSRFHEREHSER